MRLKCLVRVEKECFEVNDQTAYAHVRWLVVVGSDRKKKQTMPLCSHRSLGICATRNHTSASSRGVVYAARSKLEIGVVE